MVSIDLIKQLREISGAGIQDCKKALEESNGDLTKAIEVLRKKGFKDLEKRSARSASEGTLGVYVHPGDRICAVVELNCETDFVAKNEEFKAVARELAMQVAAMKPLYISREHVPEAVLEKEREIVRAQYPDVPDDRFGKILEGKLNSFFSEVCLLEQMYIKDNSKKVFEFLTEKTAKFGEKIEVSRFTRFEVGERSL
ncbi:MAG: elongation factor Ts [Deltaproteobacteria bacterium]|nr:elongation factor Ts [Deltaproteobacteria bacterium]